MILQLAVIHRALTALPPCQLDTSCAGDHCTSLYEFVVINPRILFSVATSYLVGSKLSWLHRKPVAFGCVLPDAYHPGRSSIPDWRSSRRPNQSKSGVPTCFTHIKSPSSAKPYRGNYWLHFPTFPTNGKFAETLVLTTATAGWENKHVNKTSTLTTQ